MTEHPNLASALVAALAELTVVEQTRTAKIPTKTGGEYSYKYADIGDVVKVSRPILAAHGVVALTPVHDHGDGLACTVTFLHSSGDRLDLGPFPFPHGETAQATGSMVTYHRRYALVSALGIAASDDDDGASAAPRRKREAPARPVLLAGWVSLDEQKEAHDAFKSRVSEASVEVQAHMRDWRKERGLGWPMSAGEFSELDAELARAIEDDEKVPA